LVAVALGKHTKGQIYIGTAHPNTPNLNGFKGFVAWTKNGLLIWLPKKKCQ